MSFRYQKRINLGKGLGLNVSSSGVSSTYRTKFGSIGSRGFSLKTGIPGLSYRGRFGKNALPVVLVFAVVVAGVLVLYNLMRLFFNVFTWIYERIRFLIISRRSAKKEDTMRH